MPKATFHPQAWQNDYAIPVDPEGETEWEVTDEELDQAAAEYGVDRLRVMESDQHESDEFRHSKNAPDWVRNWSGPFYISFEGIEECKVGIHSWVNEQGKLPPDTRCTICGEPYGDPDEAYAKYEETGDERLRTVM